MLPGRRRASGKEPPPRRAAPCGKGPAKTVSRLGARSNHLISRNSGRKTATHFSWDCSRTSPAARTRPSVACRDSSCSASSSRW
ncbi:hypothetical protein C1M53_08045 [Mesorhizobium sp. Pch-S]|nr:hypothetical protein C1M53_08045 [Mesorhizobium sp. Pch-S]